MTNDNVNHPSHYCDGRRYEPMDVIENWSLGFHLGNAVKYISRAGRKGDAIEDLEKARWYLDRYMKENGHGTDMRTSCDAVRKDRGLSPMLGCILENISRGGDFDLEDARDLLDIEIADRKAELLDSFCMIEDIPPDE